MRTTCFNIQELCVLTYRSSIRVSQETATISLTTLTESVMKMRGVLCDLRTEVSELLASEDD